MYEYPHLSANSDSVLLLKAPMKKPSWGIFITHRIRVHVLSYLHQPPLSITQSLPEGLSGHPLSGGVKNLFSLFSFKVVRLWGWSHLFSWELIEIKGGSCWWGWLWSRFQERDGCRVPLQSTLSNPAPLVGNQIKLKAILPCENKEYAHGWRISWVFSFRKLRLQGVRWMNGVHICPRWVRT